MRGPGPVPWRRPRRTGAPRDRHRCARRWPLTRLARPDRDDRYLSIARTLAPNVIVSINAPLTLPRGRCCLDDDCGCRHDPGTRSREVERQLAGAGADPGDGTAQGVGTARHPAGRRPASARGSTSGKRTHLRRFGCSASRATASAVGPDGVPSAAQRLPSSYPARSPRRQRASARRGRLRADRRPLATRPLSPGRRPGGRADDRSEHRSDRRRHSPDQVEPAPYPIGSGDLRRVAEAAAPYNAEGDAPSS